MYECCGDVCFLNRRVNVLGAAAADAVDEVREMVPASFSRRSRLSLVGQPRLVRIVSIDGEIPV